MNNPGWFPKGNIPFNKNKGIFDGKKQCSYCLKTKPLNEFFDRPDGGKRSKCKSCFSKVSIFFRKRQFDKEPWLKHYFSAKSRCLTPSGQGFGRIKFHMSRVDFKELWLRDNGWLLKRPNIDRINSKGNYDKDNCRFVEKSYNTARENLGKPCSVDKAMNISIGHKKRRSVKQFSLDGKLLNEWACIGDVFRETGILRSTISNALNGRTKTAGGFIWL